MNNNLPPRTTAEDLLRKYIENEKLRHHCFMVAEALEAYANELGEDTELWFQTGLLHDLDWEKYPDEHPNYAISDLLRDYPQEMKQAIAAHAPERTGQEPETTLDKYLFACDEASGFLHAVSLMRPTGFSGMKYKSFKKKFKDKSFAANIPREDITHGAELIEKDLPNHIEFLISVFNE